MTGTTTPTDTLQRAARSASGLFSFEAMIYGYWGSFWIMNGLDKYLKRTTLLTDGNGDAVFTWFGKDRSEQFGTYFDRLSLDPIHIDTLLNVMGVIELLVGIVCVAAMALGRSAGAVGELAIKLTFAVFIAFCIGDVVMGDRAELLEHSTYIAVVVGSYLFIALRAHQAERKTTRAVTARAASPRFDDLIPAFGQR